MRAMKSINAIKAIAALVILIVVLTWYWLYGFEENQTMLIAEPSKNEQWISNTKNPTILFIVAVDNDDFINKDLWKISQRKLANETFLSIKINFHFRPSTNLFLDSNFTAIVGCENIPETFSYIFFLNDFDTDITIRFDEWFEIMKIIVGKNYGKIISLTPPPFIHWLQRLGSVVTSQAIPIVGLTHFFGAEIGMYRKICSNLQECSSQGDDMQYRNSKKIIHC